MNFLNIFNSVESNLEKSLKDFNHSDSNNFINELQKSSSKGGKVNV